MLKPGRQAWGLWSSWGFKARKQSPEAASRIPEQGRGTAGLGPGVLACQPGALLTVLPLTPGSSQMFSLTSQTTDVQPALLPSLSPPVSLPLILILQAPEGWREGGL